MSGKPGVNLTLAGNIKTVVDASPGSTINLASGQAHTITMDEQATDSKLNIASGAEVGTVNLDVGHHRHRRRGY